MIDTLVSWKFYLFMTLLCVAIQGIFAMLEMACVSFNKVRLQYYVSQNHIRAKWLSYLIKRPTLLFGVTLIGVNTALQVGSECSRRFYDALGLSPDLAPLSQIIIVLIFAELAPMFAGRRYAESVAMLGIPFIYFFSIVLRPVIWVLDLFCRLLNRLIKSPVKEGDFLTREEIQFLFEKREDPHFSKEINRISTNIFFLKNKTAKDLMITLPDVHMVPSFYTVGELREWLRKNYVPYVPVYQRSMDQIIGIVYPRDLLRLGLEKRIKDYVRPAWFITEKSNAMHILRQFRQNNQSVAIVLNASGAAIGILTLDELTDEIFGRSDTWESFGEMAPRMHHIIVDRSFSGDMKVEEFNQKFSVHLEAKPEDTLEDLMSQILGHPPEAGESTRIDQFELSVEEAPLIGPKIIAVRTVF